MTTNKVSFGGKVDEWCRQSEARMLGVFRQSSQELFSIAANGVPVDTGFARASGRASKDSMPKIDPNSHGNTDQTYPYDAGEITTVIATAQLGETLYYGWTANYILPLEYGHSRQAPNGFARLAALQWQQIVDRNVQDLKSRVA